MPNDALDPGPNGDYPFAARNPDGTVDRDRFPTGTRRHRVRRPPFPIGGPVVRIDLTPRDADGEEIVPPTLPPE